MTALKYSRQRESIKDYLMHTDTHPTADMVYLHVKEQFPNISLGTVYRNLNLLSDMGEIMKISTPDGADRFDGRTIPHYHFFCTECNSMQDMNIDGMPHIDQLANESFDGLVESHTIIFYGKCGKCLHSHSEVATN